MLAHPVEQRVGAVVVHGGRNGQPLRGRGVRQELLHQVQIQGIKPSMKIDVHHCLENIFPDLGSDGTFVKLKAVLGLLVKASEKQILNLRPGMGPLYLLQGVSGESQVQHVDESMISLNKAASNISEINAQVVVAEVKVITDNVVIKGHIEEDIFAAGVHDNLEYNQKEIIPLTHLVEIPGVCEGMEAAAWADVEKIKYELDESGTSLNQKIVYHLYINVIDEVQTALAIGDTLIETMRVVGTDTLCQLLQQSVSLVPAVQKINKVTGEVNSLATEVIAGKVVVQGLFVAEISFSDEDGINYETEEELPFIGYLAIEGALPGMDAKVTPSIAGIITELKTVGNILEIKALLKTTIKVLQLVQAAVEVID